MYSRANPEPQLAQPQQQLADSLWRFNTFTEADGGLRQKPTSLASSNQNHQKDNNDIENDNDIENEDEITNLVPNKEMRRKRPLLARSKSLIKEVDDKECA